MLNSLRKFFRKIRNTLVWLWNQEGTPGERARGLALGVFSGCFPLFGLQMFLGVILSNFFKGNRLLAISGTWISNPMTYIPLYWINYRVGCLFLGPFQGVNSLSQIASIDFWNISLSLLVRVLLGSSTVGTIAGLIVGLISYFLLKDYQLMRHR